MKISLIFLIAILTLVSTGTRQRIELPKTGAKPILTLKDANHPVISADGRRVLVAPSIHVAEVYDVSTGRKLLTLNHEFFRYALSGDGKQVALFSFITKSVSEGKYTVEHTEVKFFDVDSGKLIRQAHADNLAIANRIGEDARYISSSLRFMANPSLLEEIREQPPNKSGVLLADLQSLTIIRQFGKYDANYDNWNTAALTPDARVLAATRANIKHPERIETVVWDAQTGRELLRLPFNSWWLELSADGRRLVTARSTPPADKGNVVAFSVTPNGQLHAEAKSKGSKAVETEPEPSTEIWDITSGERVSEVGAEFGGQRPPMLRGALSPDGKLLATASHNYALVWDADTGKLLAAQPHVANPREDSVRRVMFSDDGAFLVMGSMGEIVKVWRIADVLRHAAVKRN